MLRQRYLHRGDGILTGNEGCNDGNTANGNGCTKCKVECGYICTGSPSTCVPGSSPTQTDCVPRCGDGVVTVGEDCDLGTANNKGGYNGCNSDCTYGPFCGDAVVNGTEQCDDGTQTKSCSANCMSLVMLY